MEKHTDITGVILHHTKGEISEFKLRCKVTSFTSVKLLRKMEAARLPRILRFNITLLFFLDGGREEEGGREKVRNIVKHVISRAFKK